MRRVLEVVAESRHCYRLRGPGVRSMVLELTGRAPVWSAVAEAFTVAERTAGEVTALAESRGYDVVMIGPRSTSRSAIDRDVDRGDHLDVGHNLTDPGARRLW